MTYENATYNVMDQLLNTLGNGIRDDDELMEHLAPRDDKISVNLDPRYLTEDIYCGYYEMNDFHGIQIPTGDFVTSIDSERNLYPDVIEWIKSSTFAMIDPYPSFDKQYSTVHRCPKFLTLGTAWLNAAIDFYERSRIFLIEHNFPDGHLFGPSHWNDIPQSHIDQMIEMIDETISMLQIVLDSYPPIRVTEW